jgi:FtsZ-interacting cell division protein YlmF
MFEKWIKKLSNNANDEETDFEFKSYEEEKEELCQAPEEKCEEAGLPVSTGEDKAGNIELKVVRPESMEEVFTIADYLIDRCTVVLNLELLDKETIKRMLDFLNGVSYTMGGEVRNVSQGTYIITPTADVRTVM